MKNYNEYTTIEKLEEALFEDILETVDEMSDADKITLHNNYCDVMRYYEDRVFTMFDFDDYNQGRAPFDIARDVAGESFNPNDKYFIETIYGFKSLNYAIDCPIDFYTIAKYVWNEENGLEDYDLEAILEAYNDRKSEIEEA